MQRPTLIAGAIAVALAAWLVSGVLWPSEERSAAPVATEPGRLDATAPEPAPFRVVVHDSVAAPVVRRVVVNGRTEAARKVELRAEVKGRVVEVSAARGQRAEAGQRILQLDERDRTARLRMAEAMVAQRRIEHEAAQRLRAKGFQAETEAAAKAAALEETLALLEGVRIELDRTTVHAPFAGIVDQRPVEIGDFVEPGDVVATVIEVDPLKVVAYVAEAEVADVHVGMPATARTVSGQVLKGEIRYVAKEADPTTRTFRIELEAANPENRIGAGTSAELLIALDPVQAHQVSAAVLVLDDTGRLGVQSVDLDDRVRFLPATIVRAQADAVWLAGLPERFRLVTVGQGFVRTGQKVEPVPAPAAESVPAGNGA